MKAKLRGHHLICLNFFKGEGYSEDFIKNIYSVVRKEKVEVVYGADDVCARCPYLKDNRCSNSDYTDEKILYQDKEALKLMALKQGMIVDRKTISARIPQIIERWKVKFCLDCGYRKVCFNE
jgi:hypothetical protein